MGVIAWIVLGAVAGLIAENLTGKKTGLLLATVIGIAGALLGGFLAKELFGVQTLDTFFNPSTWITAIIGAVVLFLLFGAVRGRGGRPRRTTSGWRSRSRANRR
ncbi:GlsB/YeaQ/YmgE family stress response membrane protein [Actinomycetes bacterium KLBMP 9797]